MDPNQDDEFTDSSRDSSSSDETTSSDSSVSLKQSNRRQFESTKITSEIINLPKDLCDDKIIFDEFFSLATWHGLSDPIRKHLSSFLPMFTDNIEFEKKTSIEMLFTNRITRFGNCPLKALQQKMEKGNCRPEISTLNKSVAKAERREQRFQECERIGEMTRKLAISRERALRSVCRNVKSADSSIPYRYNAVKSQFYSPANILRAKKRYWQEITSLAEQLGVADALSDEEKCSDITSNYFPRKQRRLFGTLQGGASSPGADVRIVNTMGFKDDQTTTGYLIGPNGKIMISERHYRDLIMCHKRRKMEEPDHPELDCQEIKLKDVVFRTQASSGYRRIMPLPKVAVTDDMLSSRVKPDPVECDTTDTPTFTIPELPALNEMALPDIKPTSDDVAKHINSQPIADTTNSDESLSLNHSTGSSRRTSETETFIKRTNLNPDNELENYGIEPRIDFGDGNSLADSKAFSEHESDVSTEIESINSPNADESTRTGQDAEQQEENVSEKNIIPECFNVEKEKEYIPGEVKDENIQLNETPTVTVVKPNDNVESHSTTTSVAEQNVEKPYEKTLPELMQETHKCFLSLIRDMFCSTTDHRLTIEELKIKLNLWLKTPIAALNDWYQQADDKWDDMLQSAILFLSGEFSDQPDDFVPYIEYKMQLNIYQWIGASRDSDHRLFDLCQYWLSRKDEMGIKAHSKPIKVAKQKGLVSSGSSFVDDDDGSSERTISPPPPRYPTDWSVRKATDEETLLFREQERRRYENPHMAFTYKQHSYNSVVGPVKGIYTQVPGISKARGHNMLVADRPNFVTILTLVRDATARLPNGEGTRADICELLKSSQYISPTATDQVLQTIVSGALDRMHTEHDPCVKYDTKRKIWIYLHRNRTEEEFERLHHQYQGVAKHKKYIHRKPKQKESTVVTARKTASAPSITTSSVSSFESESVHSEPTSDYKFIPQRDVEPISSSAPISILIKPTTSNGTLTDIIQVNSPFSTRTQKNEPMQAIERENMTAEPLVPPPEQTVDKVVSENKTLPKTIIGTNTAPLMQSKEIIPIRVSSSCKIQPAQIINTNTQAHITVIPAKTAVPSEPMDRGNQATVLAKKNITTSISAKPLIINTSASSMSNLCSFSGTVPMQISAGSINSNNSQSFLVPVSLSAENIARAKLTPSVSKPVRGQLIQQANLSTAVKTTSLLQAKVSTPLLQQQTSTSTKCIVQPESIIVATNKQPKMVTTAGNTLINTPAAVILKTESGTATTGADIVNTITLPKGQQSVLTPAQQKQILQNLLAQQHKQVFTSKSVILGQPVLSTVSSSSAVSAANLTTNTQTITQVRSARQLQKIPALTLSSAASKTGTPSGVFQTIGSTINNPHVIQIKSTGNVLSATGGGAKIQPVVTAAIKEQAKQLHHQSLITKTVNLPLKTDVHDATGAKATANVNVLTETPKSLLVQSAIPGTTVTRLVKSTTPTSAGQPTTSVLRTVNVAQGTPHVVAKVVKNIGESQIVTLDNLLPNQRIVTDASLRLADHKAVKTQLIQLSGGGPSGSPIAQYAVVPQNRNVISVAQSSGQFITQTVKTTTATKFANVKPTQVFTASHTTIPSASNAPTGTNTHHTAIVEPGSNTVQTTLQQPLNSQQNVQVFTKLTSSPKIISAKARNGTSFLSSPGINIATIGGNPLIIASKPTIQSDPIQQNSTKTVFHNPSASTDNTANIVYGRQTVKVQGNIVSQGHINLDTSQHAGSNSAAQKVLLSNQLVKVRTVPRPTQQIQFSFAQQPSSGNSLNTNTAIGIVKPATVLSDQQQKSPLNIASPKPSVLTTPVKAPQKVGIRLNQQGQRVVLATQGGQLVTQQIIVPRGFQGGAFNIKRLKVIPVSSQQKGPIIRSQPIHTIQGKTSSSPVAPITTTLAVSEGTSEGNAKLYHISGGSGSNSSNVNEGV